MSSDNERNGRIHSPDDDLPPPLQLLIRNPLGTPRHAACDHPPIAAVRIRIYTSHARTLDAIPPLIEPLQRDWLRILSSVACAIPRDPFEQFIVITIPQLHGVPNLCPLCDRSGVNVSVRHDLRPERRPSRLAHLQVNRALEALVHPHRHARGHARVEVPVEVPEFEARVPVVVVAPGRQPVAVGRGDLGRRGEDGGGRGGEEGEVDGGVPRGG